MANEESENAVATAEHDHEHPDQDEFEFVEPPKFDVDYKGDCEYEVKVTVPAVNKAKQAEELYDELKSEAEIPGFRRGRAPVKLIERKFGKAVKGEVTAKLVSASFQKLIQEEDLKPAGMPDVDGLDEAEAIGDEVPLEFTLKFDVVPRVELGKYRGIEIERPVVTVDDKDVQEAIEDLRERYATFEPMKTGKAKEGDQVIIDFKGMVDGEEFSGGSAENYPYILGSKRFFPEFEEAIKGQKPGAEVKCEVTFPDDYFSEDLQGKKADFTIKINEVKRKKKPELDEEFAKEAGYESVDELKQKTKDGLQEGSRDRSRQIAESRAIEKIVEESSFEISPRLIDQVASQHLQQELQELIQQGLPRDQFEERIGALQEASKDAALRSIKTMVALNEIGEAEGIEVTEDDLDQEAASISQSMGASVEMVAQYIKGGEQRSQYVDRIYRNKALAIIMDNATITDKELSREDFEEEIRESSADEGDSEDAD